MRPSRKTTSTTPMTSRSAATEAAAQGFIAARETTAATVTSSAVLTATLLAGSGDVLTATRSPALTAWLAKALKPPAAAEIAASRLDDS